MLKVWLTYFKRQFVLFSSPDFKSLVVTAEFPEVLCTDGKKAAGHDRTLERPRRVCQVFRQQRQPLVVQLPIESAAGT